MLKVLLSVLIGIAIAILGMCFAAMFASVFNGLEYEIAVVAGLVMYLTVVVVVCARLVISKIETTKGQ